MCKGPCARFCKRPDVLTLAHRGASAERPEHTRAAYLRAIEQGCDYIEPDVVMSADGVLVVRHDVEIGQTTDVADHRAFAERRRTRSVDGQAMDGWFACDFSWAELQTLRCRERLPALRPGNSGWTDEPILRLEDVADIARHAGVGIIPELKHPLFHVELGLDIVGAYGQVALSDPLITQCFEVGPLRRLGGSKMQLIAATGGPADRSDLTYADMITPQGLAAITQSAEWIGVEAALILAPGATLIADAHAAGLKVAVWTLRPENVFLPPAFQRGADPAGHGDLAGWAGALKAMGVDAMFSDAPGIRPATAA